MGHQLYLLASSFAESGEARLAVALGESAIQHYEKAEAVMRRKGRSARERAEVLTHLGNVQDRILGEKPAAKATWSQAAALDAGAEQARQNLNRLSHEENTQAKPDRSGHGG